jgi:hypothetical protein
MTTERSRMTIERVEDDDRGRGDTESLRGTLERSKMTTESPRRTTPPKK